MKQCDFCAKLFTPRRDRPNLDCSLPCANQARRKHFTRPCEWCRQNFQPPRNHSKQKFCGLECRDNASKTTLIVPCSWCSKPLLRKYSRVLKLLHHYCDKMCESAYRRAYGPKGPAHVQFTERTIVICSTCEAQLQRTPSEIRNHNFCNIACRTIWQQTSGYISGANSPTWRGGEIDYRGPNWEKQRQEALQRDKFACVKCNTTTQLQVHHCIPFVTFASYLEANQLDNLQTLCMSCHKKADWAYWQTHPETPRLWANMLLQRIHICRHCHERYVARTARSLDCDICASRSRKCRARSRTPSLQKTSLFFHVPLGEDHALAATL